MNDSLHKPISICWFQWRAILKKCGKILNISINTVTILEKIPAGNYMFKINNRNTRTRCERHQKDANGVERQNFGKVASIDCNT